MTKSAKLYQMGKILSSEKAFIKGQFTEFLWKSGSPAKYICLNSVKSL